MMRTIEHRGPDGAGEFFGESVHLGAVRLAIIDVKNGDQPVSGCRRAVTAVYNGEIYNQYLLRQRLQRSGHQISSASDSALIPHLYEEYGAGFVEMLRGMYAFAIWDEERRRLLLARDRLGIKPLFVAETQDFLVFSSEIKAIVASGLLAPEIDPASLDDLFTLSYPCPPRTMFKGIREVLPGHTFEVQVDSQAISMRRYWTCPFPPAGEHRRVSRRDAAEELLSLMKLRVYDHLVSDLPVGTYLSGGIDSSVIAAVFKEVTGDAPTAFSVSFDDERFDELGRAREVSRHLGSPNHIVRCDDSTGFGLEEMIWHTELPLQFPLALPLMRLARLARTRGFPVVLTGEGADEIFGGYDCFRADKMRRVFDRAGLRAIRKYAYRTLYKWHDLPDGTVQKMLSNHSYVDEVSGAYGGVYPPWYDMWTTVGLDRQKLLGVDNRAVRPVWEPPDGFDRLLPSGIEQMDSHDAGIAVELVTRLPAWILLIGDRASMSQGVEARVPLLDHEIVEFVASLPPTLKLEAFREKAILRRAARGLLPKETLRRRKQPFFTPIREWFFMGPSSELFDRYLSKRALVATGLFDPDLVSSYLSAVREVPGHLLLRHQLEWTLMLVLGTQVLHRLFVQDRCARGPIH